MAPDAHPALFLFLPVIVFATLAILSAMARWFAGRVVDGPKPTWWFGPAVVTVMLMIALSGVFALAVTMAYATGGQP
jgi:hypothetical protein